MLAAFCILLLSGITLLSYKKTHSFFHPAVIVSLFWGGLLLAYQLFDHGLYPLSYKFFFAILLWVTGFCFAYLWYYNKRIIFSAPLYTQSFKVSLLKYSVYLFVTINIVGIYKFYSLSGGIAYNALVEFSVGTEKLPLEIRILQLLQVVSITLYTVLVLYRKQTKVSHKWMILHAVTLFVWAGITANKTGLFQLVAVSVVASYIHKKLSFSKILVVITVLLVAFYYLQNMRAEDVGGDDMSMKDIALTYVLSPMPAFDMVLNGEKQFTPGRTWRFFTEVANKLGLTEKYNSGETGWVNVPVLTNVYTVMFPYYVDFGYWGIFIFSLILGSGWGVLYNEMKRGIPFFTVIYAVFIHTLVLQFFADYIVNFLSMVIQINIFCAILLLHYKIKYPR